jgi:hypothetical protein
MNQRFLTRKNGLALAVGIGLGLVGGNALAQSNASGVIFGRTAPGATIHVQNKDTGQNRDLTVGTDGRYRATALPIGNYKVSLEQDGKVVDTRDNVSVAIGGTEVSFAAASSAANAQNLEGVQVVANALPAIDVSSTDSRTVLTAQQLQKIPVQRNVTAAALLAPGTVLADTRYGNVASFGGASASENQYYINGFSVTNALTGVGLITLPFDAIDQQQILTSAYTAEYGRATGGVVNIVSKRGTNTWQGDVQVLWTPESLTQSPRSIYRKNGVLMQDRSNNKKWETQYSASVGGPLIKDKLFIYLAGDFVKDEGQTTGFAQAPTGQAAGGATNVNQQIKLDQKATRWLGKIDWNITDNHILEFTGIGDDEKENDIFYAYNYATGHRGAEVGTQYTKNYNGLATNATPGGNVYLGKYTGYITDDLTVTALYGKTMSDHQQTLLNPAGSICPVITDNAGIKPPHCNLVTSQLVPGANDRTRGWRLDLEYKIGSHDLRGGVDNYNIADFSGTAANSITYNPYVGGAINGHPEATFPAGTTQYAALSTTIFAANVRVSQQAQYLEDNWQVSDRWLAYLGLRNEQFTNFNGNGQPYARQRHQLAPRLGVSWDVFGDSTLKVYANAGRYHISIPASTAIRGASGSIFTSTVGTFTGVDPVTGAPVGFVQSGTLNYINGENGVSPDPKTVAAKGLKAYYQDEYVLGFDKQLSNDWIVGSKAIYRKLRSSIDDWCDNRPFQAYATAHGIALTNPAYTTDGSALCFIFNPGVGNKFFVDTTGNGNYQYFNLTKKDIGVPDLKRGYYALDTYLEHQFDSHWYGKLEYVFSRSYGNSEGQLDSDIGQQDVSTTESWDFAEIMQGTNGPLPNDRTHQLKAYGFYQLNDEWLFGSNVAILSGAPKNCIGYDPSDADATRFAYGAAYFFCNGKVSPRGSPGRMPWTYTLNINAEYKPAFANHKLAFTADIFNLLGKQEEVTEYEIGELAVLNAAGTGGTPNSAYGRPLSFQSPRTFRFGVRYDFSL